MVEAGRSSTWISRTAQSGLLRVNGIQLCSIPGRDRAIFHTQTLDGGQDGQYLTSCPYCGVSCVDHPSWSFPLDRSAPLIDVVILDAFDERVLRILRANPAELSCLRLPI